MSYFCPACEQPAQENDQRYIVTGIVNTPILKCTNGYCGILFIRCDPGGSVWGIRTVITARPWLTPPPPWTTAYKELKEQGLI